jgi:hypothetical protein
MSDLRRFWIACALLLVAGFAFRFAIARYFPNDTPDDGKLYAQLARNLLEQHVFSDAGEPPYDPTLIRLPGYPLFIASVYSLFGHTNNTAVRITQAVIDTISCGLIALIAYYWEPDEKYKIAAAIAALAFAVVCPFSTIYTATILTETITIFLLILMCLTSTLAFQALTTKRASLYWFLTGLVAGIAVFFRPDSGLFAAAIGITLLLDVLLPPIRKDEGETVKDEPGDNLESRGVWNKLARAAGLGAVFSVAFCLVLAPWTIRNWKLFHLFQPLAPAHAEMPGEFVPRGYLAWLRTWTEDQRYIGPVLWKLDSGPINIDDFPPNAFDSEQEKQQVAALLKKYNQPVAGLPQTPSVIEVPQQKQQEENSARSAPPQPSPGEEELSDQEESPTTEPESEPEEDAEKEPVEESLDVKMTPEIDAEFAKLANERITRAKLRYYLLLPYKRAVSLWFDTHSQYYPFEGELLPLEDLDHTTHQHIWLPLFAGLTFLYTLFGVIGAWLLWRTRDTGAKRWVILTVLLILLRLGFFATLENPEPRYVVEFFPLLTILAGIATIRIAAGLRRSSKIIVQSGEPFS